MADNLYQIGDLVEFTQDHPNLEQIGNVLGYVKGGKGVVSSVKPTESGFVYVVTQGLTDKNDVPESHLFPKEQEVKAKVEQKLNEDQKNKAFKDIGARVRGSAKEVRAYDKVLMSDLTELELDAVTAQKFVVKEKVYPEVNVADERGRGVSSGAAYLKVKIREACGTKPPNDKNKRAAYVKFIEKLTTDLTECYTLKQVKDKLESYKLWSIGETIGYLLNPYFLDLSEEERQKAELLAKTKFPAGMRYYIPKLITEIFSKRFANMIFFQSDAAMETYREAKEFEAISEEESAAMIVAYQLNAAKQKANFEADITKYTNADTSELKKLMGFWTLPASYKADPEGFRRLALGIYEKKLKNIIEAEGNIPEKLKARPDDWSWFEKPKERKEAVRSGEPTINTWQPLSYISRTKGLVIDENFVNAAASTDETKNPITSIFGFKSVQYGNALKDKEARQHVKHFLGGMADLAEILDFDIAALNKLGGLSIAFAARGKKGASAHYESSRKIINLTNRNGDGSLCHEYGHYLDNMLASVGKANPLDVGYGSTIKEVKSGYFQRREISEIDHPRVDAAMRELMGFIKKGKEGITQKVALRFYPTDNPYRSFFVRGTNQSIKAEPLDTMEETIEKYAAMSIFFKSFYGNMPDYQREMIGALVKHFDLPYYDLMIQPDSSQYYYYSSLMSSKYWIEDWELFARAFETYVFDKLADKDRKSTYLVSGEYFNMEITTKNGESTYVYPFGTEREYLYGLYDNLMAAMKEAYSLGSFVPFTDKRMDEYLKLEEENENFEKVESGVKLESISDEPKKEVEIIKNDKPVEVEDVKIEEEKPTAAEITQEIEQDIPKKSDMNTESANISTLRYATNWDQLPNPWIKVKKVTKLQLGDNIESPEYKKLFDPFINKDELRPSMGGVLIEDEALTATNAFVLLSIPNKVTNKKGLIDIMGYHGKKNDYIEGVRFPAFRQILPDKYPFVYEVDLIKLKTYCQAVILGKYPNSVTKQINFKFGNDDIIGYNGELLSDVCSTFLQLGHKTAYFSFDSSSRACIISENKAAAEAPQSHVGKNAIGLIMPMMTYGGEATLGASEIDLDTQIKVYYSFIDNEIHNADGSIAKFDPNADSDEVGYLKEDQLAILKKFTTSKAAKRIPILEYVRVQDGDLKATDLENYLVIKNINVPDGLYEVVNGALKPAAISENEKADNYPNFPEKQGSEQKGTILADVLSAVLNEAKGFISDDDLRPVMMGVSFNKVGNYTIVYATDAHKLYKRILQYSNLELDKVVTSDPEFMAKIVSLASGELLYVNESDKYTMYESSDMLYINQKIDARQPDYDQVIKRTTNLLLEIDKNDLNGVLADAKKVNAKGQFFFKKPKEAGSEDSPVYVSTLMRYDFSTRDKKVEEISEKIKNTLKYSVKDQQNYNTDISLVIVMPVKRDASPEWLGFDPNNLKPAISLSDSNTISFRFEADGAYMMIMELPDLKVEGKKEVKKAEPKPVKVQPTKIEKPAEVVKKEEVAAYTEQDVKDAIEALEILAEDGDKEAIDAINALKLLL